MRNVATVTPMILPARFALFMLAMAEEMEQNTIGTTTQNIRFTNTVPIGSSAFAPSHSAPTTHPATMPSSIQIKKP